MSINSREYIFLPGSRLILEGHPATWLRGNAVRNEDCTLEAMLAIEEWRQYYLDFRFHY